jgi:nitrite reductase/ring-hydroxylating ferredoxin subunit
VAALAGLDPDARAVADELKSAIEEIHRVGLVTMARRMRADDAARAALFDLVDDPTVHMLLSLHGIVRPIRSPTPTRCSPRCGPNCTATAATSLARVEDGIAFVRLEGRNGCSMSSVTLRNLVEEALVQGVPSITAVEVPPNEPTPTLIPVESLRIGRDPASEGWVRVGPASGLAVDELSAVTLTAATGATVEVIVVNAGQRLSAYRNECAHEALPLNNAVLDLGSNTLTCPWHGFCYDATSGSA